MVPIATAFFVCIIHAVNPVGAAGGASGCATDALAAELVSAVDRAPIGGKEVPVAKRGSAATHAARGADQCEAPSVGAESPKAAKGRAPPGGRLRAAGAAQLHGGVPLLAPRVVLIPDIDDRWANASGGVGDRKGHLSGLAAVNRWVDIRCAQCQHLGRRIIGRACGPWDMAVMSAKGGGAEGAGSASGNESLRRGRLSLGKRDCPVICQAFCLKPGQLAASSR